MSKPSTDFNERLEQPVRQIIGHLVAGEFAELEALTKGQRLNARDMGEAIRDYGRKLVMPPDDAFRLMDVVEVRNTRQRQWSVWMPLWTQEEGRSDLTIEVELIADGENFSIGLDNIRVP